jgi:hypothetical protein
MGFSAKANRESGEDCGRRFAARNRNRAAGSESCRLGATFEGFAGGLPNYLTGLHRKVEVVAVQIAHA